jgi:indole-3-glycerol phosphate synthase
LVEVHDEPELTAVFEAVDPDLIGINNRDLRDFSVDVSRTHELLADIPAGKIVVSESGLRERGQLAELERVGVDAVLIGETLLASADPLAALELLTGGHDADFD